MFYEVSCVSLLCWRCLFTPLSVHQPTLDHTSKDCVHTSYPECSVIDLPSLGKGCWSPRIAALHFWCAYTLPCLCLSHMNVMWLRHIMMGDSCFKLQWCYLQAEQQKKAAVISAEGDAQAAVLLAKSFGEAGEGLVELRRIEAAEDIAYQLSRSRQVAYLPPGQNILLNLPAQ